MKLQLQLFTATSEIRDKFHCCYWDFCMDNETGMVLYTNIQANVLLGESQSDDCSIRVYWSKSDNSFKMPA